MSWPHEHLSERHPKQDDQEFLERLCGLFRDADRLAHLIYENEFDDQVTLIRKSAYRDICALIHEQTVPPPVPPVSSVTC